MSIGKGLGIFAVASMLLASPAWADHMTDATAPDDNPGAIRDNGGTISDDSAALPRQDCCDDRMSAAPQNPGEAVLEGRVAAVDRESGAFILSTDEGLLRLKASPEDVQHLRVGDRIQVALIDEDTQ